MTRFLSALTSATCLALGAISLSAIASQAQAAEVHVQVADLDLSTPIDAARFLRRLDAAAVQVCGPARQSLQARAACRAGVREEAIEKLGVGQRASLQIALRGGSIKRNMQLAGY
jgi:UrcA family protein